ncbi:MAG: hydroxymethylbilane synthase [Deltaproteobacteria bacterium]
MKSALKLGTRGSQLALWQAQLVADQLKSVRPELSVEIRIIKTTGDKILDVALSRIGDKGLFTKEIENELLQGGIDVAVHSMKDLPSDIPDGLCIGAVLERENPCDVLISPRDYRFNDLPEGAIIGTSSLRRIAQLKACRPDLSFCEIRGNVETRIKKMREMKLDGIVLAYAGVKRLGYEDRISEQLPFDLVLPAAGQGSIAVECRERDEETRTLLQLINDVNSELSIATERAFLKELQGGCQVPIACLARLEEASVIIDGLAASLDGTRVYKGCGQGSREQAATIGRDLARRLLHEGADAVLEEIRRENENG